MQQLESEARAIVPGDPAASALMTRVASHDESLRMPPEGEPLTSEEIAELGAWIEAGAAWEQHWAFRRPVRRDPPAANQADWVRNPIDAFLLRKLEERELAPARPADRRTLARRAFYNLTGLPPTQRQIQEFLDDGRPDAFARLVDRLLDSPHYGERWARHWLDVVRYAESNSFERDNPKPNVWKYRDYVIRSFNDDKPYDQFLLEQLAGDELDEVTPDSMIATGYFRLGLWDDEPADPVQAFADEIDDLISTTGKAMLGLTINCARCHDHKIDPIPQRNYYGMAAFFADVTPYGTRGDQQSNNQWDLSGGNAAAQRASLQAELKPLRKQRRAIEQAAIARMPAPDQRRTETDARQQVLDEKLDEFLTPAESVEYVATMREINRVRQALSEVPAGEMVLALARTRMPPPTTFVALRGNPHVPGESVEPHFPDLFGEPSLSLAPPAEGARSAGRRRRLAEWIASPDNMLTARVIVNRVWQHHFGRGIVRSASNFGELGVPPTHPELLDWLALWLVDHQWRLKPLHRLIMNSNAYRMSSRASAAALATDPANDLWSHFDLRRLSAEEIRDATLVTTGEFNGQLFGPSFYSQLSPEVLATQSRPGDDWGESDARERARRSIYLHVKRSLGDPLLVAFDFPDTDVSCAARFTTTQPGQALAMINGRFFHLRAASLAKRVAAEAGPEPADQIRHALRLVLNRSPTEHEIGDALALFAQLVDHHGKTPDDALRFCCLAALNLSEFIYLD